MTGITIYLDEDSAADVLRISKRTIQRWRKTGEGPSFIRAGARRVLYSRDAIDAWVEAHTFEHHADELARGGNARAA